MTAADLRAVPTWVDWRGRPPKVTIPAATRDALADVLDAAREALDELGVPTPDYPAPVANVYTILAAALAALDALDADQ